VTRNSSDSFPFCSLTTIAISSFRCFPYFCTFCCVFLMKLLNGLQLLCS